MASGIVVKSGVIGCGCSSDSGSTGGSSCGDGASSVSVVGIGSDGGGCDGGGDCELSVIDSFWTLGSTEVVSSLGVSIPSDTSGPFVKSPWATPKKEMIYFLFEFLPINYWTKM